MTAPGQLPMAGLPGESKLDRAMRLAESARLFRAAADGSASLDELRCHGPSYLAQLRAERDKWIREAGLLGWQRELNRRRAERIARSRNRRRTA